MDQTRKLLNLQITQNFLYFSLKSKRGKHKLTNASWTGQRYNHNREILFLLSQVSLEIKLLYGFADVLESNGASSAIVLQKRLLLGVWLSLGLFTV